jgi:hypothetical protein
MKKIVGHGPTIFFFINKSKQKQAYKLAFELKIPEMVQ